MNIDNPYFYNADPSFGSVMGPTSSFYFEPAENTLSIEGTGSPPFPIGMLGIDLDAIAASEAQNGNNSTYIGGGNLIRGNLSTYGLYEDDGELWSPNITPVYSANGYFTAEINDVQPMYYVNRFMPTGDQCFLRFAVRFRLTTLGQDDANPFFYFSLPQAWTYAGYTQGESIPRMEFWIPSIEIASAVSVAIVAYDPNNLIPSSYLGLEMFTPEQPWDFSIVIKGFLKLDNYN